MKAFFLALALVLGFAASASAQSLTITGLDGKTTVLQASDLADLPRGTVTVTGKDGPQVYEGPIISYVLRAAGQPVGPKLHGDPQKAYVVVKGSDGFWGVFSLAELDKDFHSDTVILADHMGGKPLPAKEAPWRLASSGDKKGWRSVFAITSITLKMATAP